MYIPKSIIDWLDRHNVPDKRGIYRNYYNKLYPPFDNTCSKEEYMEKLDKAIEEIKQNQQIKN